MECENEPMMPRLLRLPRNRSLPRAVVTRSAPIFSASASIALRAPARCAPSPATMSGWVAFDRSAAAAAMDCGLAGAAFRSICRISSGSSGRSISASCTFVGKCKLTAAPVIAAATASASTARAAWGLVAENVRNPAALSTPGPSIAL